MSGLLVQREHELAGLLDAIDAAIDAGTDPSDELVREAESLTTSVVEKRDAYAYLMRACEAEEAFYESEIARLVLLRRRRERSREWLGAQVLAAMTRHDVKKLPGQTCSFTRVQNPPRVEVGAVGALPPEYVRETITHEPDKKAIRAALERGEDVPGARLVPGEWRLQVK